MVNDQAPEEKPKAVHLEKRRTRRSVPHSSREEHHKQVVPPRSVVDVLHNRLKEPSLHVRTDKCLEDSNTKECLSLFSSEARRYVDKLKRTRSNTQTGQREETHLSEVHVVRNDFCSRKKSGDIGPRANGKLWGKLPGLKTRVLREVVQRLPEVEDLERKRERLGENERGKKIETIPSSQSEIPVYIAEVNLTKIKIRKAREREGTHGGLAALHRVSKRIQHHSRNSRMVRLKEKGKDQHLCLFQPYQQIEKKGGGKTDLLT